MAKLIGIYVGRCLTTNKVYVGSGRCKARILGHQKELAENRHDNSYLQRAWNKYGADDFVWVIVELCEEKDLLTREQWWVSFLRATDRRYGFNRCYPVSHPSNIGSHLSLVQVISWQDPVIRGQRLTGLRELHKDPEWKSRRAADMAARWADPVWRAKMLKILSKNVDDMKQRAKDDPSFTVRRMRGLNKNLVMR